uniref:G-protein coupled receptors family 1 profile domain-containing protein n=1 Tax=Plectus sambesii TaxID=2011161 RepID=A0A914W4B1_9BILA
MLSEPLCRCPPELSGDYGDGPSRFANIVLILASLPIIATIGVITNIISLFIYNSHSQLSSNRYLAALAGSDLIVCLTGIFVIAGDSLRSYSETADQLYVLILPKTVPLVLVSQMLSVYLTVFAAIDCYVSVSPTLDHWRPYYCRPTTANWMILSAVVLSIAYNLIAFLELETISCFEPSINATRFELCPTELRISDEYVQIYRGYMYAAVMAFLPFTLLSILTIAIVMALRTSRDATTADDNENSGRSSGNRPIVLVMVVLMFLLCNIVSLGVNVLELLKSFIFISWETQSILIDVGNVLVVINATANFFVYIAHSESYRRTLVDSLPMEFVRKLVMSRRSHFRVIAHTDSIELEPTSRCKSACTYLTIVLDGEQSNDTV